MYITVFKVTASSCKMFECKRVRRGVCLAMLVFTTVELLLKYCKKFSNMFQMDHPHIVYKATSSKTEKCGKLGFLMKVFDTPFKQGDISR